MHKYKNLLLNTGLFAFSQFATKLITFLLVPLYTAYLSTSQFGVTDMSLTVVNMLLPIATLSISDAVLRYVIDEPNLARRYATIGLMVVVCGSVLVAVLSPLLDLSFFGGLGDYKLWFIAVFIAGTLQYYFSALARAINKLRVIPVASIATTMVTVGLSYLCIARLHYLVEGYFIAVIAGNVAGIATFVLSDKEFRRFDFSFNTTDWSLLRRMMIYSVPMIPNALFWWIGTSINRFFITGMIGIAASGLFAAAQKIPGLLTTVAGIFQQAWQLSAFQEAKKSDVSQFFSTVFRLYHAGIAIVSSGIIVMAQWLASLLLQKDFFDAWPIIAVMILALYLNVLNGFYGSVFTSAMKTMNLMTTTIVGAVASMLCTWLLIPPFGIYGAALAMVVSNGLVLVLRIVSSRRVLRFEVNWYVVGITLILLAVESWVVIIQIPQSLAVSATLLVLVSLVQIIDCRRFIGAGYRYLNSRLHHG